MAHFRAVTPPRMLGTPRTATIDLDLPVNRALGKFYGEFAKQDDDPCLVRGLAASAGTARGPARVATTLQEAVDLRPGEVLVTITTSPEWTPLFSTAAAIVTDAGGPICHCAIVAREYGLPAVVGTGAATSRIRTGQILEVDGAAGLVRIVTDA
jgi:pyruvate,water dikinase